MHRIPHGHDSSTTNKRVVFLWHGNLCSSADWIITGATHGLGYILADEGYDVWMGNARGNLESRNHSVLNPDKDAAFWDFSFHEMGTIDLPTMIDYVLEQTGQDSLLHVGHSQGTTTFYTMTSELPQYNAKVRAHISLASMSFMNHMTSPLLQVMAYWSGNIAILTGFLGINEFSPTNDFLTLVGGAMCGDGDLTQVYCTNSLFALCGFSPLEMNATILPVLMGHTPAGCSVKQFLHYSQLIVTGTFRQYDYGIENFVKYGTLTPPAYDLSAITTPIHIFYSYNDWLSAVIDVSRLCDAMGNACTEMYLVSDYTFNHLDYIYGIHAPEFVYKKLIDVLANY